MAENRVIVEGIYPPGSSLPVYAGSTAATLDVSIDGAAANTATAYGFLL